MLSGSASKGDTCDIPCLPPIKFDHSVSPDTPMLQMRCNSEWHEKTGVRFPEELDRFHVEMIVVIMRYHNEIY